MPRRKSKPSRRTKKDDDDDDDSKEDDVIVISSSENDENIGVTDIVGNATSTLTTADREKEMDVTTTTTTMITTDSLEKKLLDVDSMTKREVLAELMARGVKYIGGRTVTTFSSHKLQMELKKIIKEATANNENDIVRGELIKTIQFKCTKMYGSIHPNMLRRCEEGDFMGFYMINGEVPLCHKTIPELDDLECVCLGDQASPEYRNPVLFLYHRKQGKLEIRMLVNGTTNSVFVSPSSSDSGLVLMSALFPATVPSRMKKTLLLMRARAANKFIDWYYYENGDCRWQNIKSFIMEKMKNIAEKQKIALTELVEIESVKKKKRSLQVLNKITDVKMLYNILIAERTKKSCPMTSNRVPHGNFILRPYQCRALKWMIERETTALTWYKPELWYPIPGMTDLVCNFDAFSVLRYDTPPKFELRGGILADEMGLGKTVEFVGLILLRPHPRREDIIAAANVCMTSTEMMDVSEDGEEEEELKKEENKVLEIQHKDFVFSSDDTKVEDDEEDDISNVAPVGFRCDMCERIDAPDSEPNIYCNTCKHWFHSTCCGGISVSKNTFMCAFCCESPPKNPVESIGTLIVAPEAIILQWKEELERHVRVGHLKMGMYDGVIKIRKKIRDRSNGWQESAKYFNTSFLSTLDVLFCT